MAPAQGDPLILFGLRVKELRALQGMTQEELAEACGLFRTYLSRIESGRANPTLTVLLGLARALTVEPSDLLRPPVKKAAKRVLSKQPLSRGRVTG